MIKNTSRIQYLLYIFILSYICTNCNIDTDSMGNIMKFDISSVKESKAIIINNYTKSLAIVPLETTSSSLFTDIDRLYEYKDRFYILSKKDNSIMIFLESGKFLKKIQNLGKGPGEYIQITDFTAA